MSKKFIFVNVDGDYEESLGAFEIADHVDSSAGVADAGKPIILDANGQIDPSFIDFGAIDHGSLSGLLDDDHPQYILVDGTRAFTGDQSMGGNSLTNVLDPVNPQDATTKAYVDAVATGLRPKGNVAVATTANITLSGTPIVDGYQTVIGDRILVKDQTLQTENGIYVVSAGAWTRSEDQDNAPLAEVVNGVFVPTVLNGTTNVDKPFFISSVGTGTDGVHQIGIDPIIWELFTSPTQLQAGDGIEFVGNVVNADLLASGGLKFVAGEIAVEPADFSGDGLIDDGSDNIAIDFATTFTIDAADAKAPKASDYASTATGEGASRVGIEDASTYYTGNQIEAALTELGVQLGGDTSSTYNFTEENVLTDNDPVYAALNKLDLRWGDLGSTANGEGASLVGIEDAGGFFTGSDVEAALQELGSEIIERGVTYTAGTGGVTKGDLVYVSAADTASTYSNIQVTEVVIGAALETAVSGQPFKVLANDTILTSVLGGSGVPGTKYFWTGSGYTTSLASFVSGDYIWLGGTAKNGTDVHVQNQYIKRQS